MGVVSFAGTSQGALRSEEDGSLVIVSCLAINLDPPHDSFFVKNFRCFSLIGLPSRSST
jgi:hypothetical protein